MKRTEARIKQEVLEDSMNTRRTLRKAIAGFLKQTVANTPAVLRPIIREARNTLKSRKIKTKNNSVNSVFP